MRPKVANRTEQMTIQQAVAALKKALAVLQSNSPAKVEVAAEMIRKVIAGLESRSHK